MTNTYNLVDEDVPTSTVVFELDRTLTSLKVKTVMQLLYFVTVTPSKEVRFRARMKRFSHLASLEYTFDKIAHWNCIITFKFPTIINSCIDILIPRNIIIFLQ